MLSSFSSAVSGVRAAQRLLDVSSSNIANANTPGYHAQHVSLSSRQHGGVSASQPYTSFQLGLDQQLATARKQDAYASEFASASKGTSTTLSTVAKRFNASLSEFKGALNGFKGSPAETQNVVSTGANLARAGTDLLGELSSQSLSLTQRATDEMAVGKAKLPALATYNEALRQSPNDPALKGQAMELAKSISDSIGGSYNVLQNGTVAYTPEDPPGGKAGALLASADNARQYAAMTKEAMSQFAEAVNTKYGGTAFSLAGNTLAFEPSTATLALNQDTALSMVGAEPGPGLVQAQAKGAISAIGAERTASAASAKFDNVLGQMQEQSGVDLVYEVVVQKQAATMYQANIEVIKTQDAMFQALLNIRA